MTYALWIVQILLALFFLAAGAMHAFRYEQAKTQSTWVSSVSRERVRIIGLLELFGGAGLVLPALSGVLPWLMPLAAVGLALVMASAIVFHLTRGEQSNAAGLGVVLALTLFVAVGRLTIAPL